MGSAFLQPLAPEEAQHPHHRCILHVVSGFAPTGVAGEGNCSSLVQPLPAWLAVHRRKEMLVANPCCFSLQGQLIIHLCTKQNYQANMISLFSLQLSVAL